MPLKLYITRTITDTKTGKVIGGHRRRLCKSFVKAFMQHLEILMAHAFDASSDLVSIKDVDGTDRSVSVGAIDSDLYFACEAPPNEGLYGTLIGIGTTAPAVADHTIETQILHGISTAEKMEHGATSIQSAGVSGSDMEMTITRAFVNSSGGTIVVKEVGVVTKTKTTWYFLILHDAVDDSVANGQTYTVTYTFTTTV